MLLTEKLFCSSHLKEKTFTSRQLKLVKMPAHRKQNQILAEMSLNLFLLPSLSLSFTHCHVKNESIAKFKILFQENFEIYWKLDVKLKEKSFESSKQNSIKALCFMKNAWKKSFWKYEKLWKESWKLKKLLKYEKAPKTRSKLKAFLSFQSSMNNLNLWMVEKRKMSKMFKQTQKTFACFFASSKISLQHSF